MSSHALGIIIGGMIPALIFGIVNLAVKAAADSGIGVGWYVLFVGIGVVLIGSIILLFMPDRTISLQSSLFAGAVGFGWGLGIGLIVIALNKFGLPISVLTPLFNMNTLVTVLLALWIFAEWKQVRVPQLLFGSVLIVIGGTIVARS